MNAKTSTYRIEDPSPARRAPEGGVLFSEDPAGLSHEAMLSESTIPCRFFLQGYCSTGRSCRFSHHSFHSAVEIAATASIKCQFHARGYCKAGDLCKFSHDQNVNTPREKETHNPAEVPVCRYVVTVSPTICSPSFFQSLRGCKNPNCHFKHINPANLPIKASPASAIEASNILERYSSVKKAESRGSEVEFRRFGPP
jgi:hypothetical protein